MILVNQTILESILANRPFNTISLLQKSSVVFEKRQQLGEKNVHLKEVKYTYYDGSD